ncbi:MAG TPA: HisA/HisF-related TIM barrel protein [Actinomycetota bacterium]|nr:HisA/HisF-related TIM barrel protein [Actinomycetota bacterium]
MGMEVIPAIDVAGGRLARFAGSGTQPVGAFEGDPLSAARSFAAAGARWAHVVDLDLASNGRASNAAVVRDVAEVGLLVQASGGVSSLEQIEALRGGGATRVVLGSAALGDREATADIVASAGDALVVAVEADGPTIRPRGGGPALPLWETLQWLAGLQVPRLLFVEVGRVGRLEGPDLDGIWALATHTGRPVIASGGIRDLEDLRAIAALGPAVEAAVVGRALYEGGMDLAEAIAAVA